MSVYKTAQLFDLKEGLRRKEAGITRAAAGKIPELARCQEWAIKYGRKHGHCNAQIVAAMLDRNGYEQLGCAAGSLFRNKELWKFIPGDTFPSARPKHNGHHLRNWIYIGG